MKKNTKLVLGILASILCFGAIGTTTYFLVNNENNPVIPSDKEYEVNIYYFKDDVKDESLTSSFKQKESEKLNLFDYRIDIKDYEFISKSINGWTLNIKEDTNINFYYQKIKEDDGNEDLNPVKNVKVDIYTSDDGINGDFTINDTLTLTDLNNTSISISNIHSLVKEKKPSLSDYHLNFASSYLDGNYCALYLYKNSDGSGESDTPEGLVNVQVSLFVDYLNDDESYIGGQYYSVGLSASQISLNNILSNIQFQDNTISKDLIINYSLSKIEGNKCDLYVYEDGTPDSVPDDKEYDNYKRCVCNACGSELEWQTGWTIAPYEGAACPNINCGGDGYFKEYEYWVDPENYQTVKMVFKRKGESTSLTKEYLTSIGQIND